MNVTIDADKAGADLERVIDRALAGEDIIIVSADKRAIRLLPIPDDVAQAPDMTTDG